MLSLRKRTGIKRGYLKPPIHPTALQRKDESSCWDPEENLRREEEVSWIVSIQYQQETCKRELPGVKFDTGRRSWGFSERDGSIFV